METDSLFDTNSRNIWNTAMDQHSWSWQGFSILLRDILAWWMVADTGFKPIFAAEGQSLYPLLHIASSMLLAG